MISKVVSHSNNTTHPKCAEEKSLFRAKHKVINVKKKNLRQSWLVAAGLVLVSVYSFNWSKNYGLFICNGRENKHRFKYLTYIIEEMFASSCSSNKLIKK